MPFQDCVSLAVEHELSKSAIQVAVRKVRGRVGTRHLEYDAQFESYFRSFAEKVSAISLAPIRDDLSCVGAHEDWRQTFADDTARRLKDGFGSALVRCFPVLATARPDTDLQAFVRIAARQICREMSDAAPAIGFVRDALWGVVNVVAQVSRCVSGDLDPMILVDPSNFAPIAQPPSVRTKALPQPQDCN